MEYTINLKSTTRIVKERKTNVRMECSCIPLLQEGLTRGAAEGGPSSADEEYYTHPQHGGRLTILFNNC